MDGAESGSSSCLVSVVEFRFDPKQEQRLDLSELAAALPKLACGIERAQPLLIDRVAQHQSLRFAYTHGTSAQRMRWFGRGFDTATPASATPLP